MTPTPQNLCICKLRKSKNREVRAWDGVMLVEEEFCFRPMELGNNFIDTYTHSSFSLLFNCKTTRRVIHKGKMPLILVSSIYKGKMLLVLNI